MIRIQKYISECGYSSRRKAEELIKDGKVLINGKIAKIGDKVDENNCHVKINGKLIKKCDTKVYIALNKPSGYISAVKDDKDRKTVVDLLKGVEKRVFPVGRLDYDTEGLLILTNDGEFTNKVTHPKYKIKKTYFAITERDITENDVSLMLNGIEIDDYTAKADKFKIDKNKKNRATITISQGKNRQVRKMFEATGNNVKKLRRISIGKFDLGNLKIGEFKYINNSDLNKILGDNKND